MLSGAALLIFILAYPLYSYLNHAPAAGSLICVQIVFGLLSAAYTGPIPAAFADLFPTRVLSTGLSTAYNLTVMLIGALRRSTSHSCRTRLIPHSRQSPTS